MHSTELEPVWKLPIEPNDDPAKNNELDLPGKRTITGEIPVVLI